MAKEVTIKCDYCNTDITSTYRMPAYRLKLSVERLPNISDLEYSLRVLPPIDRDYYFCEEACLINWANNKWPRN